MFTSDTSWVLSITRGKADEVGSLRLDARDEMAVLSSAWAGQCRGLGVIGLRVITVCMWKNNDMLNHMHCVQGEKNINIANTFSKFSLLFRIVIYKIHPISSKCKMQQQHNNMVRVCHCSLQKKNMYPWYSTMQKIWLWNYSYSEIACKFDNYKYLNYKFKKIYVYTHVNIS